MSILKHIAVVVLLTAAYLDVLAAAPDTAGRNFLLPLPNAVSANLTFTSVDGGLVMCTLSGMTSDSLKVNPTVTYMLNRGVQIECDKEIVLSIIGAHGASPVFPSDALGTEYVAAASEIVITAIADDTSVNLLPFSEDTPRNYTLRKGGSVEKRNSELRGTQVKSDKLISVLNGDRRGENLYLISLPPVNTWGTRYILRTVDGHYRILGSRSTCTFDGNEAFINDSLIVGDEGGILDCDMPVLVTAHAEDGNLSHIMQAINQFSNKVTLATAESDSKLNILVTKEHFTDDLLINGQAAPDFTGLDDEMLLAGDYTSVTYSVPNGTYKIEHKNPTVVLWSSIMDGDGEKVLSIAQMRMANTGSYCQPTEGSKINDGLDNDCDSRVDEELLNGEDDDGDGLVDEDLATNEYYGDLRSGWWLSYTVVLLVLLVILLVVLIAICHWQCSSCNPEVKDIEQDPMVMSCDSGTLVPARYSLSGSWSGFTITRR